MSELEKMYENANIKKEKIFWCGEYDCFPKEHPQGYQINCFKNCGLCSYTEYKYVYPPFTAEKQLDLIKWLGELDMLEIMRTTREDKAWIINSEFGMSGNVYKHTSRMNSFEEALAELINSLWQDITEQEKIQIADILKG